MENNNELSSNCEKSCSPQNFYKLYNRYKDVIAKIDAEFGKAQYDINHALLHLRRGICYNTEGNAIKIKIDEWLDKCSNSYLDNCDECQCNDLRQEQVDLIQQIESLNVQTLYHVQMASDLIDQSRKLDAQLQNVKSELEKDCYPPKCR